MNKTWLISHQKSNRTYSHCQVKLNCYVMLVSRQHKQHNLQVSGGKATLVARVLRYVRTAQQILEPEDNDATSDSELQSSDSEDPDNSEDDAQSKAVYTTEKFGTDPLKSDTDRKFLQICFFLMGTDLCFLVLGP